MILLICRTLKKDTNELIYKTEIDSQIQKNLWLPKGKDESRDELGVWN